MANKTFLDRIKSSLSLAVDRTKTSMQRFQVMARELGNKNVSANRILASQPEKLTVTIRPEHIGKMSMFFYDPKLKATLPYYDRFPLIIPLEIYKDGFLGLNLHYLPPMQRARLMDVLYQKVYPDAREIDQTKKIRITYQITKRVSRNQLFKPCVKRYLYGHLRSRIFILPADDWDVALFLPTQRFTKASDSTIWRESMKQVRGS